MSFTITGKNIEVTPAIKSHTEKKFDKLTERFPQITNTHVILMVDHLDHIAEATMHFPAHEVFASAKASDMYIAIDELAEKLLHQIQKQKEKIIDTHQS